MHATAPHATADAVSEVVHRSVRALPAAAPDEVGAMATCALEHALTHGLSETSAKGYAITATCMVLSGRPLADRLPKQRR